MPFTWRINIKKNPKPPGPAVFEFDLSPQDVKVGDQVIWSNTDTLAHYPTPVGQTYAFMPNQIAPGSTSPAFAPGTAATITYTCAIHPEETGSLVVNPAPPQK
jgi:plastocyanin